MKNETGKNVPNLEISELVLVHCNINNNNNNNNNNDNNNNNFQQNSKVL